MVQLARMKIPRDGDPVPPADPLAMFDWDEDPEPDFEDCVPEPSPAVPIGAVKVIVFDLIGTIFVSRWFTYWLPHADI